MLETTQNINLADGENIVKDYYVANVRRFWKKSGIHLICTSDRLIVCSAETRKKEKKYSVSEAPIDDITGVDFCFKPRNILGIIIGAIIAIVGLIIGVCVLQVYGLQVYGVFFSIPGLIVILRSVRKNFLISVKTVGAAPTLIISTVRKRKGLPTSVIMGMLGVFYGKPGPDVEKCLAELPSLIQNIQSKQAYKPTGELAVGEKLLRNYHVASKMLPKSESCLLLTNKRLLLSNVSGGVKSVSEAPINGVSGVDVAREPRNLPLMIVGIILMCIAIGGFFTISWLLWLVPALFFLFIGSRLTMVGWRGMYNLCIKGSAGNSAFVVGSHGLPLLESISFYGKPGPDAEKIATELYTQILNAQFTETATEQPLTEGEKIIKEYDEVAYLPLFFGFGKKAVIKAQCTNRRFSLYSKETFLKNSFWKAEVDILDVHSIDVGGVDRIKGLFSKKTKKEFVLIIKTRVGCPIFTVSSRSPTSSLAKIPFYGRIFKGMRETSRLSAIGKFYGIAGKDADAFVQEIGKIIVEAKKSCPFDREYVMISKETEEKKGTFSSTG